MTNFHKNYRNFNAFGVVFQKQKRHPFDEIEEVFSFMKKKEILRKILIVTIVLTIALSVSCAYNDISDDLIDEVIYDVEFDVSDWSDLQNPVYDWHGFRKAIVNATDFTTITLVNDIITQSSLRIPYGIDIILKGYYSLVNERDGASFLVYGNLTLDGPTIIHNARSVNAHVLIYENGTFTMYNGRIIGNSGGIRVMPGGTFIMHDGEIRDLQASWGGVSVWQGTFIMHGGIISGNNAAGIDALFGTVVIYCGEISGNVIRGVDIGGGVFTMHGGVISENFTNQVGGGVLVGGGVFLMNGGRISDNDASLGGGGVAVNRNGRFIMHHSQINNNTASFGSGVAVFGSGYFWGDGSLVDFGGGRFNRFSGEIFENTPSDNYIWAAPDAIVNDHRGAVRNDQRVILSGLGEMQSFDASQVFGNSQLFNASQLEIFHGFFDNFEMVEFTGKHGWHIMWSHITQNTIRLVKQIFFYAIDGFESPMLILSEFPTIETAGELISHGAVIHNVLTIRDGKLSYELSSEEFNEIFIENDRIGWTVNVQHEQEYRWVEVNGELLFFLDFSGSVEDVAVMMDIFLGWLREFSE